MPTDEGSRYQELAQEFAHLVEDIVRSNLSARKNKPLEAFLERHTSWKSVAVKAVGDRKNLRNRFSEVGNRPERPRHLVVLVPSVLLDDALTEARAWIDARDAFDVVGLAPLDVRPSVLTIFACARGVGVPMALSRMFPNLQIIGTVRSIAGTDDGAQLPSAAIDGPRIEENPDALWPGWVLDAELVSVLQVVALLEPFSPERARAAFLAALAFGPTSSSSSFETFARSAGLNLEAIESSPGFSRQAVSMRFQTPASSGAQLSDQFGDSPAFVLISQADDVAERASGSAAPILRVRHIMVAFALTLLREKVPASELWQLDVRTLLGYLIPHLQSQYPSESWLPFAPSSAGPEDGASPTPAAGSKPEIGYAALVGRYTADDPSAIAEDLLDVQEEAGAFARIMAAKSIRPPLAIGIFGEWGAGKTYFMQQIDAQVERLKACEPNEVATSEKLSAATTNSTEGFFLHDIVQIRFDAWHYTETNLWASLVEYIFAALDQWMLARSGHDQHKTDLVFDRLATARQLKLDALEELLLRRESQRLAEERARRARAAYERALALSQAMQPAAYLRALLDQFLTQPGVREDLLSIGHTLGVDALESSAGRFQEVLTEARTEAGRARLVTRSALSKLSSTWWLISTLIVLIVIPSAVLALKDLAGGLPQLRWVLDLHDGVLGFSGFLVGAAGVLGTLVRVVRAGLRKLEALDRSLNDQLEKRVKEVEASTTAQEKVAAELDLQRQKQTLDAAERALADAEARLVAARDAFENGTARGRLNAFIRAKVTDGDYAKHLGIIAAIRRDFGQLAGLMRQANEESEERRERQRLASDAEARVKVFLQRIVESQSLRITATELTATFALLEPANAISLFQTWRDRLEAKMEEGRGGLDQIAQGLERIRSTKLPRFSRIILYIDDLDRCPPEKVVDVLQAVHLLLCFSLFVVVVAVDARWVSRALHERFPKLLNEGDVQEDEPQHSRATSYDYLEKIFQIPYWVRPMNDAAASRYVNWIASRDVPTPVVLPQLPTQAISSMSPVAAMNSTSTSEAEEATPIPTHAAPAQESAPSPSPQNEPRLRPQPPLAAGLTLTPWEVQWLEAFAPHAGRTPRRAIRFVNVYRLIKTSLSGVLFNEWVGPQGESPNYRTLIAQLAVFTSQPRAAAYILEILDSMDGARPLLDALAQLRGDRTSIDEHPGASEVIAAMSLLQERSVDLGLPLTVANLRDVAPIARRYSFGHY